jgi:hypothetical protein
LQNENSLLRAGLAAPPAAQATDTDGSELERLRGEHRELIQLRGQVAQLRRQVADQPKASANPTGKGRDRADDPKNSFESENAQKLLAKSPEIPMIPAHEFTYSGYATPQDSLRTITWASAKRDTNAMLGAIGLEPEARTRADELFAHLPAAVREKYATVDALLVDWRMNLAEPPEAYRVLSQREQGPDAMVLTVQFQYPNTRMRENDLTFYRDQDGVWRNAMPSGVMDKLPGVAESLMQAARK